MVEHWYSREYLGRHFDKFLESDMKPIDFLQLQQELQLVSVQLQELNSFIANGYQSKTGRIHISRNEERAR